jgi:hypothetical protein
MSRINHSCTPNAFHIFDANTDTKWIIALNEIKKGDEICIDYCHPWADNISRKMMKSKYGIECNCGLCKKDAKIENIRQEIWMTNNMLKTYSMMNDRQSSKIKLNLIEKLLKLFDQYPLKVDPKTIAETYYEGFYHCGFDKTFHKKGLEFLQKAYGVNKLFGEDLRQTQMMIELILNPYSHPVYQNSKK